MSIAYTARGVLPGYVPDMRRAWLLALALIAQATPYASRAEMFRVPPAGRDGWVDLELPKVDEKTRYEAVSVDGRPAIRSHSRCAASALTVSLEGLDLAKTPLLRWSWRIPRGLEAHDERAKQGDDFAARVYVLFSFDRDRASWSERIQNRLGRLLYGREVPGNALNYVWTTREPAGESWDNPFAAASKMISVGRGALPDWREQAVDVYADYVDLFGHEPPTALGLAVMTDTDNTCAEAAAVFADFRFEARSAPPSDSARVPAPDQAGSPP